MTVETQLGMLEAALDECDLESADVALEGLRAAWRRAPAEERLGIASRVAPLRARRDDLASEPARAESQRHRGLAVEPRPLANALEALGVLELRPGQAEAIQAAMDGRDCLAIMPTGSGKSLCYMAPALALGGLTLVISPLIALIADQHRRLVERDVASVMLAGTLSLEENREGIARIRRGETRIAFCAPERLGSGELLAALRANRLDLFVVDEAHCLVEWGDDFRPEYLRLAEWRDQLGARATMALTASATKPVAAMIESSLGLRDVERVRLSVDRPNISFEVHVSEGKGSLARRHRALAAALAAEDSRPAIVYTRTRRDAEELPERLSSDGINATAYHAGLADDVRQRAHDGFMAGDVEVICATNAFGLGVDKPDIRSVLHWGLPVSIEGYYQEAGRAGRDGRPARAALLGSPADLRLLRHLIDESRIPVASVERTFNRVAARAGEAGEFEVSREELERNDRMAIELDIAVRIGAIVLRRGGGGLVGELRISSLEPRHRSLAMRAAKMAESRRWEAYRAIRDFALTPGCPRAKLLRHFDDPARCSEDCDGSDCNLLPRLDVAPATRSSANHRPAASRSPAEIGGEDGALLDVLKAWRRERADGKPAYTVCKNAVLLEIIARRPTDPSGLAEIPGVGATFLERHAEDLLATLADESLMTTASRSW